MPVKVLAHYFPQLHAIPENDAWWGEGFTDWVNVRRATPALPGHHQPRVPLGGDYYDQSKPEVIRRQVEMAKAHGLHGFMHYHYWFDGKQLLETPTRLFLEAKDLDFPFCLAWANESWTRRWDGLHQQVLLRQTYGETRERWELHFQYLIRAWADPRAIRIDGKPLFLIYRAHNVEHLEPMLDHFRERAHDHGLPGLYLAAITQGPLPDARVRKQIDAVMLFQPHVGINVAPPPFAPPNWLLEKLRPALPGALEALAQRAVDRVTRPTLVDYDEVWRRIVEAPASPDLTIFRGAFVDWDNSARYRNRALFFTGATPHRFEHWMKLLLARARENRPEEQLVFVNAWNEWAEGAYLEPDERNGFDYLRALARAIEHDRESAAVAG